LVGRQLIEVDISGISNKNNVNYASKLAEALYNISDITVEISSNSVSISNRDGGNVLNASQDSGSSSFITISAIIDGQTSVGTPANVEVTITVPNEINSKDYFYEIYRTAIITVQTGLTLNDIDPGEEFQKVYESPVPAATHLVPLQANEFTFLFTTNFMLPFDKQADLIRKKDGSSAKAEKIESLAAFRSRFRTKDYPMDKNTKWGYLAYVLLELDLFPELNNYQKSILIDWVWNNWDKMKETNLRTLEKMAEDMINNEDDFKDIWEQDYLMFDFNF
jgi:hypothetical protein